MAGIPIGGHRAGFGSGFNNPLQLLLSLIKQGQSGYDEARQANESRYQDTIKLFGDNRTRTMDSLNGFGDQLVSDTNRDYDTQRHNLITDLADRGLAGSTARIGVEQSTKRERDAAVNRIKDMLIENRNAADLGFTDRAAGVMERRSDPYPDNSTLNAIVGKLAGLLGGGGGGGLFGRGGQRSLPGRQSPLAQSPAGSFDTPTGYVAPGHTAAGDAQQRNESERQRRLAMGGLTTALNKYGVDGEAAVQNALAYLQSQGWAEQNPTQGVPQIGFAQTSSSSYDSAPAYGYGGAQRLNQQPQYQQPVGQSPYDRRMAQQGRRRAKHSGYLPLDEFGAALDGAPQANGFAGLLGGLRSYLGI